MEAQRLIALQLFPKGNQKNNLIWALDPVTYTLRDVAIRIRSFLFEEKVKAYSWQRMDAGAHLRLLRR